MDCSTLRVCSGNVEVREEDRLVLAWPRVILPRRLAQRIRAAGEVAATDMKIPFPPREVKWRD